MNELVALAARIDQLELELRIQQDIHEIRRAQYTYGYFIDKSQYNEVVDLFADDGDVWFLGGIYRGKAGVLRYFPFWHGSFAEGWQKTPIDFIPMAKTLYPQDPLGPDALIDPPPRLWPATDTVPFHYPHPVTRHPIVLDNGRAREGFNDG